MKTKSAALENLSSKEFEISEYEYPLICSAVIGATKFLLLLL